MCIAKESSQQMIRVSTPRLLTWMKPVAMMMPVPNCLMTVETTPLIEADGSFIRSIGAKTPIELVTRTTNNVPILRGMS